MDIELFQWVLLGLLALGIVVLGALLATLSGIKKALEQRSSVPPATSPAGEPDRDESGAAPEGESAATADQPAATEEGSADGGYPPSRTTSSDATGSGTEAAAAAAGTPSSGQAGSIRSVLEQHGLSEGAAEPARDQTAAEPEEVGVVDSVFAAHADDPQEEPFQRDGRWWFRRGDELLLYDEASGQWQPAPEGSDDPDSAVASAGTATPAQTGGTATETGVQTTPVAAQPEVADQVATFWKCPTCGAVNGSTAATCRMCFAARP